MIAATILTLGAGSAFADGNVYAPPAQVNRAPIAQQANGQQQLTFPASHRTTVSVYSQFNGGTYADGGEN
jgi:hypothetical protein